jgi:hypothetical protein
MKKSKDFTYFLLSLVMTLLSLLAIIENITLGLIFALIFGITAIIFLLKSFRRHNQPNNETKLSSRQRDMTEEEFSEFIDSEGIFKYYSDGFAMAIKNNDRRKILWTDIESILGYKEDNYLTDTICLDLILTNGKTFKLTEETPGWYKFLTLTKEKFPRIDKDWEVDISTPVFETKLTLIYDKKNRDLLEVIESKRK